MAPREIWKAGLDLPIAGWILLLLIALFGVRWIYTRVYSGAIRRLWSIRFAAIAITLLMFVDLTRHTDDYELPYLTIAIDQSKSANFPLGDVEDNLVDNAEFATGQTRAQAIQELFDKDLINRLAKQFRIRWWKIGDTAEPLTNPGSISTVENLDNSSKLGDCIRDILAQQKKAPSAAILYVGDGAVTSGLSLTRVAGLANENSIPIYSVGTGNPQLPINVALMSITVNPRVRANSPFTISVELETKLQKATQDLVLTAIDELTGEVIAEKSFAANSGLGTNTVDLVSRIENPGSRNISVQVASVPNEVTTQDNSAVQAVDVIRGKSRVLIVADSPSPGYRFIKQTLSRAIDSTSSQFAFDVTTIVQQLPISSNENPVFPGIQDLPDFDVIVLHDSRFQAQGEQNALRDDDATNLTQYVSQFAGNVVIVPGPTNWQTILQQPGLLILPWESSTENSQVSAFDRFGKLQFESPASAFGPTQWFSNNSPANTSFSIFEIPGLNASTVVLASFEDPNGGGLRMPAITLNSIGHGSVVTHFTNEFYRLRYRSHQNIFADYWIRLVTELSSRRLQQRDKLAVIETDKTEYTPVQLVNVKARVFDAITQSRRPPEITVWLTRDAQPVSSILLTIDSNEPTLTYSGVVGPLAIGDYSINLALDSMDSTFVQHTFAVQQDRSELQITNQQVDSLNKLAAATGGHYCDIAAADELWTRLPKGNWKRVGAGQENRLWDMPFIRIIFATAVTGLLITEWVLRRRWRVD